MNERIRELANKAGMVEVEYNPGFPDVRYPKNFEKFAQLVVEAVLDQVEERAYYTGDRNWSDELDRQWVQLEFGYGPLHDAKTSRS